MVKPLKEFCPPTHAKIDMELNRIRAGTGLFRLHASHYAGDQFNRILCLILLRHI